MNIHTIEDNFDYQLKKILLELFEQYEDDIAEAKAEGEDLSGVMWKFRSELGEILVSNVSDYFGDCEELVQEEWDAIK